MEFGTNVAVQFLLSSFHGILTADMIVHAHMDERSFKH